MLLIDNKDFVIYSCLLSLFVSDHELIYTPLFPADRSARKSKPPKPLSLCLKSSNKIKTTCPKTKPLRLHATPAWQTPQHVPPFLKHVPLHLHTHLLFINLSLTHINSSLSLSLSHTHTHTLPLWSATVWSINLHQRMAEHQQQPGQQSRAQQVVRATTAVTAGGSFLILSGLILAATVIALTIATPLFVIFSPILVPAVITVALIFTGFLASGGFGVAALTVLSWIYRYLTGKHPPGADQLDHARLKLASKAREIKDRAEQFGQQHISGTQAS